MSYPFAEHEIFQDLRPDAGGGHLRCLRAKADRVLFINATPTAIDRPQWMPRSAAEELAERRELVRVESDDFQPPPIRDDSCDNWPAKDRIPYERRLEEAAKWHAVIEALIAMPREDYLNDLRRDAAVAEAAKRTGQRADRIRYWCNRYYAAGRSRAGLMRDYRKCGTARDVDLRPPQTLLGRPRGNRGEKNGRKTGLNVDREIRKQFKWAANRYAARKWTWQKCFDELIKHFYRERVVGPDGKDLFVSTDHPEPTFGQFYSHVREVIGLEKITRQVVGPTAYEMHHTPRTGTSAGLALGPGDLYAVDATLIDQYVLSSDGARAIGRPVLYVVIDYYSHLIVGFYLGLENPGWTPLMLCLANAFGDKVGYCQDLGIEIAQADWPSCHVPRKLMFDRGPEFVGNAMLKAMSRLGVVPTVCPAARPDLKGLVENTMQFIEIELTNPDARALHPREMEDRAVPGDATLTLHELELKFVHWIRMYNASKRVKRVQWPSGFKAQGRVSAIEIWDYGCLNSSAPQRKSEFEIALALLRHDTVTATKEGLHLGRGLYYETDDPAVQALLHRRKGRGSAKLEFLRDDRTVDRGLVLLGDRVVYARLAGRSDKFRGMSLFEFDYRYKADATAVEEQRPGEERKQQDLRNQLDAIDQGAAVRRAIVGHPRVRHGDMPSARRSEMDALHRLATTVSPGRDAAQPRQPLSPSLYPTRVMRDDE